jgi:hypothetical protein
MSKKDDLPELSNQTKKTLNRLKREGLSTEMSLSEMRSVMDEYAVRGIHVLWEIITNPDHEWHRRFGFEALKVLIQHTLPKRKELAGQVDQNVEVNLASLFHGNNLEAAKAARSNEIEIEVKEGEQVDTEGSGSDS